MAAGNMIEFTDDNFQTEVLESSEPVLVDFWAPWCGPCRQLAPMIEELANDYAGKVRIGKLNTDENPNTATAHQISAIPTLLVFKNGEVVDRIVGAHPKDRLAKKLDTHVG